jgi:DNA-binding transcriptional LysR family regulator
LIELKQLRSIVVLAEELNFGKAAKRLFISQPPLSRQIQAVEEELGLKLFERTKRHVLLTESGKVLVQEARRILSESHQAVKLAVMASRGETGILRIGVTSTSDHIIPYSIRAFALKYPHVHIDVFGLGDSDLIQNIRIGRIDCAVLRTPVADPDLNIDELYTEPLVAVLAQDHVLAGRKKLRLKALASETLILTPRHIAPIYHDLIITLFSKAGLTPKTIREAETRSSLATLVAANQGIAIVGSTVQEIQRPDLVMRSIASRAAVAKLCVAYQRGNSSKILSQFLEILQKSAAKKRRVLRIHG